MRQIAFLGAGSMGGAIARAVCRVSDPAGVVVYNRNKEKEAALAAETGCVRADSAREAAAGARFVLLCVKPQGIAPLLADIAGCLTREQTLVSIAAGVTLAELERQLAAAGREGFPVARLLPNTPVQVGRGLFLLCGGAAAREEELAALEELLRGGGACERVEERMLDLATPLYSCSPAYAYMFIEALSDGGVQIGVPREKAIRYAALGVLGAAAMVLESGQHPGQLKDAVCSPGGSTIAGVEALEERAFRAAAARAVTAAWERMEELAQAR